MTAPTPREALEQTWQLCATSDWKGWDPYDGLMARTWPVTQLTRTRMGRLLLIQGVKRSPINLRPILRVPQLRNPKAMALGLDAACHLHRLTAWRSGATAEALRLIDRLLELATPTNHGAGWGYPFDWQARAFWIPRSVPTVVCTGFVIRALHNARGLVEPETARHIDQAIEGAGSFVLNDLNRLEDPAGFCWSYSSLDHTAVVNATLLGAETVARAAVATGKLDWLDEIEPTIAWALARQNAEGGWSYGKAGHHQWEDGFHTAFNLLSLAAIRRLLSDSGRDPESLIPVDVLRRGTAHLANHFFDPGGQPWYFRHSKWPADSHSAAVLILAMLALQDLVPGAADRAEDCVDWTLRNLWLDSGGFAYQKHRYYRVNTPFLRWSQAWMLRALAEYVVVQTGN